MLRLHFRSTSWNLVHVSFPNNVQVISKYPLSQSINIIIRQTARPEYDATLGLDQWSGLQPTNTARQEFGAYLNNVQVCNQQTISCVMVINLTSSQNSVFKNILKAVQLCTETLSLLFEINKYDENIEYYISKAPQKLDRYEHQMETCILF